MIATIRSHLKGHLLTAEIFVFAVVVLTLVAADVLYPSTEVFLVALVLLAIINSKARAFAIDFAPFIVLIFSYDSLRNFADDLTGAEIHVRDLIIWERSLFGGGLPGYWIQQNLWGLPITPLLDVLTNTLYLSHFMSPLVVSALLWRRSPNEYWAFALGLVALSVRGVYHLHPCSPLRRPGGPLIAATCAPCPSRWITLWCPRTWSAPGRILWQPCHRCTRPTRSISRWWPLPRGANAASQ